MRIKEMDIARGFTVFIMPAVHVLMINGDTSARSSVTGRLFAFLAEGPGAQLFMLLMGIAFHFTVKRGLLYVYKKAFILLCAGYLLNFLKFIVPLWLEILPQQFMIDEHLDNNPRGSLILLFLGDILQLASLSLIVLALLYQLPKYHIFALTCILIIVIISPVHLKRVPSNFLLRHITNLLSGFDEYVYFPVLPWLIYPLTGMVLGRYLLTGKSIFAFCRNIGAALLITGKVMIWSRCCTSTNDFYKPGSAELLYHEGIVLLWMYFTHLAVMLFPGNMFFSFLSRLSRNITSVYIIQWVYIFWLVNVGGYHHLDAIKVIPYILFISFLTFGTCYLLQRLSLSGQTFKSIL